MRVLYVIDSVERGGGAEGSLADLAPHYRRLGIHLDVGYLRERAGRLSMHAELRAAGARLHPLAGRGGRAAAAWRAWRLAAALRPDLVHTTLFEADVAGRAGGWLAGVPVVSSLVNTAYGPERPQGVAGWKLRGARLLDAATARVVTRFHALTEHVAEVMAERLGIDRARVDVIPRGRDPATLGVRAAARRAAARRGLGVPDRAPVVLAVARHEYQKGLDVLVEAFPAVLAREPGARLLLAGREGNQTPLLRAAVDRLGLHRQVAFLGSRADVPDLLCAADVLVSPSRWEGFCSLLVEAMALEAPIVASDLPPVREVLGGDGERARLVPPADPAALAAAVTATLADPAGAAARAARARQRFLERFTTDRVAAEMAAFYGRALAARRRGAPSQAA